MRAFGVIPAIFLALWSASPAAAPPREALPLASRADDGDGAVAKPLQAQVTAIMDGDTFLTRDAGRVRIMGIDTPELAHGDKPEQPLATAARNALRSLIMGRTVTLTHEKRLTDAYGRRLAHVEARGEDVGARLIREGLAMTYLDSPPHDRAREYLDLEEEARRQGKGLWAKGGGKLIHQAEADKNMGCYCLVRGLAVAASMTPQWVFINFGKDYKEDFTVAISRLNWRQNFQPGPDPVELFAGKTVEARGRIRDHDGPMIEVEHPLQLRVKR